MRRGKLCPGTASNGQSEENRNPLRARVSGWPLMEFSPYDPWADIYDAVYSYVRSDIPFYIQEAVESGGPVLETWGGHRSHSYSHSPAWH